MTEYVVQSGTLSITVVADCPRAAALEAVSCWQSCAASPMGAEDRRPLRAELLVRRRGCRLSRCFSSVRVLAELRRQSLAETWKQLLQQSVGLPN
jgi:hypothetical protein